MGDLTCLFETVRTLDHARKFQFTSGAKAETWDFNHKIASGVLRRARQSTKRQVRKHHNNNMIIRRVYKPIASSMHDTT